METLHKWDAAGRGSTPGIVDANGPTEPGFYVLLGISIAVQLDALVLLVHRPATLFSSRLKIKRTFVQYSSATIVSSVVAGGPVRFRTAGG